MWGRTRWETFCKFWGRDCPSQQLPCSRSSYGIISGNVVFSGERMGEEELKNLVGILLNQFFFMVGIYISLARLIIYVFLILCENVYLFSNMSRSCILPIKIRNLAMLQDEIERREFITLSTWGTHSEGHRISFSRQTYWNFGVHWQSTFHCLVSSGYEESSILYNTLWISTWYSVECAYIQTHIESARLKNSNVLIQPAISGHWLRLTWALWVLLRPS